MGGFEHTEVTSVDCQDRGDIQSFRHRDNAGVDKVYILVVVFAENFG